MGNLQRLEAACGLLAALFGLLGLAYALFGPTYSFANSSGLKQVPFFCNRFLSRA